METDFWAEENRAAQELKAARQRCLRRALRYIPIGVVVSAIGFAMEAYGIGTSELLEMPLHVWVKLPGGIALIIGMFSLRGYLFPSQLKPLF